jgi:hypothetical protein
LFFIYAITICIACINYHRLVMSVRKVKIIFMQMKTRTVAAFVLHIFRLKWKPINFIRFIHSVCIILNCWDRKNKVFDNFCRKLDYKVNTLVKSWQLFNNLQGFFNLLLSWFINWSMWHTHRIQKVGYSLFRFFHSSSTHKTQSK